MVFLHFLLPQQRRRISQKYVRNSNSNNYPQRRQPILRKRLYVTRLHRDSRNLARHGHKIRSAYGQPPFLEQPQLSQTHSLWRAIAHRNCLPLSIDTSTPILE